MGPGRQTGALTRPGPGSGTMSTMSDERRQWPPWVVGLIAAVVLFALVLVVMNILGFGDDPVLGS